MKDLTGIYKLEGITTNRGETVLSSNEKINGVVVDPLPEDDTRSSIIYTMMISCTPIKLIVEKFDKFVVEKTQQIIKLNDSGIVRFYVSDSIDTFSKATITLGDITEDFEVGNTLDINGCIVSLVEDSDNIYSLSFSRISTNIYIKLYTV